MKKIGRILLLACMALSVTACKKKEAEQAVTYQVETKEDGISMTDRMTLYAKGEQVQNVEETVVIDMSDFDAEEYEYYKNLYTDMVEEYGSIDGVTCTSSEKDQVYTISISMDTTKDAAVSEQAEAGLLEVEGDLDGLSLKHIMQSLEDNGYEKVK